MPVDWVATWLDGVKQGYGSRFADAFRASGVEDGSDVALIDEGIFDEIEAALMQVGAKVMHLRNIYEAVQEAGAQLPPLQRCACPGVMSERLAAPPSKAQCKSTPAMRRGAKRGGSAAHAPRATSPRAPTRSASLTRHTPPVSRGGASSTSQPPQPPSPSRGRSAAKFLVHPHQPSPGASPSIEELIDPSEGKR
jgi:hypothetical protein